MSKWWHKYSNGFAEEEIGSFALGLEGKSKTELKAVFNELSEREQYPMADSVDAIHRVKKAILADFMSGPAKG